MLLINYVLPDLFINLPGILWLVTSSFSAIITLEVGCDPLHLNTVH